MQHVSVSTTLLQNNFSLPFCLITAGTFLATSLGFAPKSVEHADCKEVVTKLYKVFTEKECTLLEVNPLVETKEGKVRTTPSPCLPYLSSSFCIPPFLHTFLHSSPFTPSFTHLPLYLSPFIFPSLISLYTSLPVSAPLICLFQVMVCDAKLGFDDNAEFRQSKYGYCTLARTQSDRRTFDMHPMTAM